MMKKERKIIIKNPRLQKIRNNLRIIIALVVGDEICRLRHQAGLYWKDRDISRNTPSQKRRGQYLLNKSSELYEALNKSICYCPTASHVCPSKNKTLLKLNKSGAPIKHINFISFDNMAFVPYLGAWYCVNCYEGNELMWKFHDQHRENFVCELREGENPCNSILIKKLSKEVLNNKITPKEAFILLEIYEKEIYEKDRKRVKSNC